VLVEASKRYEGEDIPGTLRALDEAQFSANSLWEKVPPADQLALSSAQILREAKAASSGEASNGTLLEGARAASGPASLLSRWTIHCERSMSLQTVRELRCCTGSIQALAAKPSHPQEVMAYIDAASQLDRWRDREKAALWKAQLQKGGVPDFPVFGPVGF
jgi:hypothetical protein